MTKPRDPKSPYARRQKRPFVYSDHYQRWAKSVAENGIMSNETIAADIVFRRAFGVPLAKGTRA